MKTNIKMKTQTRPKRMTGIKRINNDYERIEFLGRVDKSVNVHKGKERNVNLSTHIHDVVSVKQTEWVIIPLREDKETCEIIIRCHDGSRVTIDLFRLREEN